MTTSSHVIFLNGTSSAGKTSIARLLQEQLHVPYLYIALDTFLDMFPPHWVETSDGFGEPPSSSENNSKITLHFGPVAQRLFSGYHRSIAACAMTGNNVIVDHVLLEPQWLQECVTLLSDLSVFFVGVRCPLDVLEVRERERGDRMPGLARVQFDRVHANVLYDLEVDTSLASPQECVVRITNALRKPPLPNAFQQLAARWKTEVGNVK